MREAQLRSSAEAAAAYRLVQTRVDALLRDRTDVADRAVPACPAWTVHQTVSHLAGVAQDIAALNLDGAGTEAWTQAQVDRLAGHGLDEVLDLWAQATDSVVDVLQQGPERIAGQLVFDTVSHEHDLRGALGEPGSRSADPAAAVALGFLATLLDRAIRRAGAPALQLTAPATGAVHLGDPEAANPLVLHCDDFDVLRAFGGRRSAAQLTALPWRGDPAALIPLLGNVAVRPPQADLVE